MERSKKGSGLATAPSSFKKRKNAWKKFVVLTINPLDDDVAISDIKARNTNEAYEIIETGSHNLDQDILFSEERFANLLKAVRVESGYKPTEIKDLVKTKDIILEALAEYRCCDDRFDKDMVKSIDKAIQAVKNLG